MRTHETTITLPNMQTVPVDYKIFGGDSSSAPVGAVFANGWGCAPATTEGPAEALAEQGFTVVTFEPDTTAKLTVADRVHIMSHIGSNVLGPFVAMGFSLGGDIATRVAFLDYESKAFDVAGLVDVEGSHELSDRFLTGQVARAPEAAFSDPDGILFPTYVDLLSSSENQGINAYAAHVARMTPAERAAYHFAACDSVRDAEAGGSLDQLLLYHGGPTYYVYGSKNTPSYIRDIEWQSDIRVRKLEGAAHFVHVDAPEAYVRALGEALMEANGR